jgi:phosphoglycolate phosphatase-like HAD superfamily hydrolase
MRTLVLWDIDLTLIDLRPVGGSWYQRAIAEVTGRTPAEVPPFGGRTDRWITMALLSSVDLPTSDELIARVQAVAISLASAQRARIAELGFALPGAADALRAIAGQPHITQSLVTGNLRPIAGYKLGAFGLDQYVDLDIGGYGSVSEHRPELVIDAMTRAGTKHGVRFAPESVVVIGDTPHDVHAALANGAKAVGVATGRHAVDDLRDAGAHLVLPDLTDTAAVLTAVRPAAW